jgi:GNAT superfamily N-acetyltransferase
MDKMEYDGLYFVPFAKENVNSVEEINKEMYEVLEDKDKYIAPTVEYALKCIEKPDALVLGIYNKENYLMGYTMLNNYFNFIKKGLSKYFEGALEKEVFDFKNIVVRPKFRGQAIQRRSIEFYFNYAKKNGAKYLISYYHPKNVHSRSNFEKMGFTVVEKVVLFEKLERNFVIKKI